LIYFTTSSTNPPIDVYISIVHIGPSRRGLLETVVSEDVTKIVALRDEIKIQLMHVMHLDVY
jgi:hypothetical protein